VNHPSVRLQLDQYDTAMAGEDAIACLRKYFPLVAHIQIADVPGRYEPSTGSQPIGAFRDEVDRLGYEGFVGLGTAHLSTPRPASNGSRPRRRDPASP
jgi:hydroxypyruvate isomerase